MKQALLQESRVSRCLWSHFKLQPCSLGCPLVLCYFCAWLFTALAVVVLSLIPRRRCSHTFLWICNLSLVPGWCVWGLLPIIPLQWILHLASLIPSLHLTWIVIASCILIVAKAIFMNKMMFYELTAIEGEEPVILSSLTEAISVLILRPPWPHLKEIYIIGTGLIHIWREFILSQMSS